MAIHNLGWDFLDSFADHHKIETDRFPGFAVAEQLIVRDAFFSKTELLILHHQYQ